MKRDLEQSYVREEMFGEYNPEKLTVKPNHVESYKCYYCKENISGLVVAEYICDDGPKIRWLVCPKCTHGSVKNSNDLICPVTEYGSDVGGLPSVISSIYNEARICFASASYTACDMLCRKILMNSAVNKGAEENKSFVYYVDYFHTTGFINPSMKKWVDVIRKNGNDTTHEIVPSDKMRAQKTLEFTTQLLRILYETEWQYNVLETSNEDQHHSSPTVVEIIESNDTIQIPSQTKNMEFSGRLIVQENSKKIVKSIVNYEKLYMIFRKPDGSKLEKTATPKNPNNLSDTEIIYTNSDIEESIFDQNGSWEVTTAALYKNQDYVKSSLTKLFWVT